MGFQMNLSKISDSVLTYLKLSNTPERLLLKGGLYCLGFAPSLNFSIELISYLSGRPFVVSLLSEDPIVAFAQYVILTLGVLMIALSLPMFWRGHSNQHSLLKRRKNILVEVRGLYTATETPVDIDSFGLPPGRTENYRIDFKPATQASLVDPRAILEKVTPLKSHLENLTSGLEFTDFTILVGGLAAVPAMVLVGVEIGNKSNTIIYDWVRPNGPWRALDDEDNGVSLVLDIDTLPTVGEEEIVLAISVSYQVDYSAITASFPGLSVVRLRVEEAVVDSVWSLDKLKRYSQTFTNTIQTLMRLGVKRVHVVMAAPNSVSLSFGMHYDGRNMLDLVVYQYEKSNSPAYPWGILMPTHAKPQPTLVELR